MVLILMFDAVWLEHAEDKVRIVDGEAASSDSELRARLVVVSRVQRVYRYRIANCKKILGKTQ